MKNLKYILMVLLGGIMYGTMSSQVKLVHQRSFNAAELSLWQAFLSTFCFIFAVRDYKRLQRNRVNKLRIV